MLRRLVKDESGMTMGLAVIMVVLIGVMGAGLLTFVQRDLNAVVEENRGQTALELADAGAELAQRHLTLDNDPGHHDVDGAADPDYIATCDVPAADASENTNYVDGNWSLEGSANGVTKTLDAGSGTGQFTVSIRYLNPSATADPRCKTPVSNPPAKQRYFQIVSTGTFNGATRRVEAIYRSVDRQIPTTYFATKNIDFGGSSTIVENVSLFAEGNITDVRAENVTGDDLAYGNWRDNPTGGTNEFNQRARLDNGKTGANRRRANAAGVAAEGTVSYVNGTKNGENVQKGGTADLQRYGKIDFDGSLTSATPYKFCEVGSTCWSNGTQPTNVITYPFDKPDSTEDKAIIDRLRQRAKTAPNVYVQRNTGDNVDIDNASYPNSSVAGTVYFVEFTGARGSVDFITNQNTGSNNCNTGDYTKGTIVVVNGDVKTGSNQCHEGAIIIRDPDDNDSVEMTYDSIGGNFTLSGYVNIEGTMKLNGKISPTFTAGLANGIPGLHSVEVWSWRERYE